jgi:hypothetical protein
MPWRHDFVQCFWVDPDSPGLGGYPGQESPPSRPRVPSGPAHVTSKYLTHEASLGETGGPIGAAVVVVRDRTGFSYERHVGLDDFVTVRDAAGFLRVRTMTIGRWIKTQRLRSRKQNGASVIRLRDVLRVAQERGRPVKLGSRLKIIG